MSDHPGRALLNALAGAMLAALAGSLLYLWILSATDGWMITLSTNHFGEGIAESALFAGVLLLGLYNAITNCRLTRSSNPVKGPGLTSWTGLSLIVSGTVLTILERQAGWPLLIVGGLALVLADFFHDVVGYPVHNEPATTRTGEGEPALAFPMTSAPTEGP